MSSLVESFRNAFRGVGAVLASQRNARIHAAATLVVIGLGLWLRVTPGEWALLALAIGAVWAAEAFNTALEWLADAAAPERRPLVGRAKDAAAGAVLLAAGAAAAVGLLVLGRRMLAVLAG